MSNPYVSELSEDAIKQIDERQDLIHIVGMLQPRRHGVSLFYTLLEYTHYPPDTPANDNLIFALVNWQKTLWAVSSVSIDDKRHVDDAVLRSGCRLNHGVPVLYGLDTKDILFPYQSANVYTLENYSGHPAYDNDMDFNELLLKEEDKLVHSVNIGIIDPSIVTYMSVLTASRLKRSTN